MNVFQLIAACAAIIFALALFLSLVTSLSLWHAIEGIILALCGGFALYLYVVWRDERNRRRNQHDVFD